MLYILTALGCEAGPLQGIKGEQVITGAGRRASASLEKLALKPEDSVLNIGICGARSNVGSIYLASSVSMENNRTLYPDIIAGTGLPAMPLSTVSQVKTDMEDDMLYDMEGYLIASRALKTISPSHLALVKVVSDNGEHFPSKEEITELISSHRAKIKNIAELMSAVSVKEPEDILTGLSDKIYLTEYMKGELSDLAHYAAISGKEQIVREVIARKTPALTKKEGRELIDEIRMRLR